MGKEKKHRVENISSRGREEPHENIRPEKYTVDVTRSRGVIWLLHVPASLLVRGPFRGGSLRRRQKTEGSRKKKVGGGVRQRVEHSACRAPPTLQAVAAAAAASAAATGRKKLTAGIDRFSFALRFLNVEEACKLWERHLNCAKRYTVKDCSSMKCSFCFENPLVDE